MNVLGGRFRNARTYSLLDDVEGRLAFAAVAAASLLPDKHVGTKWLNTGLESPGVR